MWPTIFEFNWDTGHMIFLGVFYSVLIVLATTLVYVFARSVIDTFNDYTEDHHPTSGNTPTAKESVAGDNPVN